MVAFTPLVERRYKFLVSSHHSRFHVITVILIVMAESDKSQTVDPKPLCSSCEKLVEWARSSRELDEKEQVIWHQTPDDLTASMPHCPFCEFMGSRVNKESFTSQDKVHFVIELRRSTPHATMVDCLIDGEFEEDKQYYPYTDWWRSNCRSTDVGRDRQRLPIPHHPGTHTSSFWLVPGDKPLAQRPLWRSSRPSFDERITVLREWLDECDRLEHGHHCCKLEHQDPMPRLPTRLLDLKPELGSDVKFVHTAGFDPTTRYTTLSHCWGTPETTPPIRTTTSSIDGFAQRIPLETLPLNYKDAVALTRTLNIRFLWIDSLCIIQDNIEDWQKESTRMSSYYQHSYLTIGAAASADSHGGFIGELDDSACSTYAVGSSGEGTAVLRTTTVTSTTLNWQDNPLLQRAWVLQEQILSPRMVFCSGSNQFFWQCRNFFASEDDTVHAHSIGSLAVGMKREFDMTNTTNAHSIWWLLVEEYCRRQLTFATDRGPAIAGLIDFYRTATGHAPLLGLWKESLCYDLPWQGNRQPLTERVPKYPSWSWLSAVGANGRPRISMYRNADEVEAGEFTTALETLSAETSWHGSPFTSPLRDSKLIVRGFTIEATLGDQSEPTSTYPGPGAPLDYPGNFEPPWTPPHGISLDEPIDPEASRKVVLLHLYQQVMLSNNIASFFEWHGSEKKCNVQDTFLCLSEVAPGRYRRLGITTNWVSFPLDLGVAACGRRILGEVFEETI
ncbi:heterokaryon incompatibility protein-domain-containing protein [Podospora aff. communis PSN243]|uniref:Heterokaryon incompatibility protein-domain-containing protein n=1 Tax=Podospora aff. communis PSN243 TaxID=3040156 RepID=A0AAV9G3Q0_9PEZI|nr:heterokaryon incompatibility protein-domain-containing protein [Podospora aff. communis PSN243]